MLRPYMLTSIPKNFLEGLIKYAMETQSLKKVYCYYPLINNNIYLSSRNIKNSKVIINSELNTYEITDANNILILESAVEGIESTLK